MGCWISLREGKGCRWQEPARAVRHAASRARINHGGLTEGPSDLSQVVSGGHERYHVRIAPSPGSQERARTDTVTAGSTTNGSPGRLPPLCCTIGGHEEHDEAAEIDLLVYAFCQMDRPRRGQATGVRPGCGRHPGMGHHRATVSV